MVIQPAEVAAKACCRGKKNNRRREGPRSVCGWLSAAQKRRGARRCKTKAGTRADEKAGAIARKTKWCPDVWFQGSPWPGGNPHLGSAVGATCRGLALGGRSDSQFWYLLRKSFGGFLGLLTRKKKAAVRYNTTPSNCLAEDTQSLGLLEQLAAL